MNDKKRAVYLCESDWVAIVACLHDRTSNGAAVPTGAMTVWTIGANRIRYMCDEILRGKPKPQPVDTP